MSRRLLVLAALGLVTAAANAQEQVFLSNQIDHTAVQRASGLSVLPLENTQIISADDMFLGSQNPGVGFTPGFSGTVGGQAVRGLNGTNVSQLTVGFDYLRPTWSHRDFTLAIPPAFAGAFPLLGNTGHTDNNFAFVPRVQYEYYVDSFSTCISASGKFISLSGYMERQLASTVAGIGNLSANSNLTIVSINPIEFSRRFEIDELFGEKDWKDCFADSVFDLSIGSRYVQVNQNYSGKLENGFPAALNIATRNSWQSFWGLGLTAAANWLYPLSENFVGFSNMRASVVIGENRRESTLSINPAGAIGVSSTIADEKTAILPIVEMELGVEWGQDLGELLRQRATRQMLTIRVAGVGQYWGGMGPLSAGSTQGFQHSDLFLAGVSVAIGFRH